MIEVERTPIGWQEYAGDEYAVRGSAVRPIRDEIDNRVRGLLDGLGVASAEGAAR